MPKKKLTHKQQRFIEELPLCKWNGTKAAIKAGYSKKTAENIASENLRKPQIQQALAKHTDKASKRADLSVDKILDGYKRIAFFDFRKLYDENGNLKNVKDMDDDTAKVISSLKISRNGVQLSTDSRLPALDALGKFTDDDKFKDSGDININLRLINTSDDLKED